MGNAREIKKISLKVLAIFTIAIALFALVACSSGEGSTQSKDESASSTDSSSQASTEPDEEDCVVATKAYGEGVLVAYFSQTGNTAKVADEVAEVTGGTLFEIVPAEPYTPDDLDYNDSSTRATVEQNDETARPAIADTVADMGEYSIIYLGFPIWWGEEPRIIDTFLETYDFSGKTIVPFCTSGSSGISGAESHMKSVLTDDVTWLSGERFSSGASLEDVENWIASISS